MATKQQLHLDILNREYSRFVPDQVLTDVQLNELIDFFENQHRLARTCLVGTGIVCGLHLYRSATSVTLAPGVAVTTDGDLLRPSQSTYVYFTKYTPPENCHYDPFYYRTGTTEKTLALYRLLTKDEKDALNSQDFKPITELDATIENWVGLLYLEYYAKCPAKCTPTNCDNLGVRQKATPKLLVCSKEDMDKIIHLDAGETIGDDIYQKYHDAYDQYFTFPVLKAKRVRPGGANALKSTTLAGAYYTAAKEGSTDLIAAIKKLYKAFAFLIDHSGSINIDALAKKLAKLLATPTDTLYAQYTYDFYKDVVATYNELRETLYNVAFECCPNIHAFPKHIMLGAPNIEYGPKPPKYRHQFYPSPAVSKNKVYVNVAISMLARMKLLVDNFKPQLAEQIRITPSLACDQRLSERAIPFYYRNIVKIAPNWSYGKSLKGQEKQNLSYNADQYAKPVPSETLKPLDYDIDPYDFFRIEGHVGRNFQDALKELNEIRAAKGVPIDLVAVRLGDVKPSDLDLDDYSCQFEDLNTILKAFQAEMNCLLAEGTTFFSGFTANAAEPHVNLKLFKAPSEQQKWLISDEQLREINVLNLAAGAAREYTMATDEALRKTAAEDVSTRISRSAATLGRETLSDLLAGAKKIAIRTDICDQFNTPSFAAARIVKTKINLNEQSFGKYFLQALEIAPDSVDNFVEKARNITNAANALKELNDDDKFALFEYPMQIIGHLNYMQQFIPGSLTKVNPNLISSYRDFSQTFCKRLKAMHTRLETYFKKAGYANRGFETVYLTMLNNLSRLCCGNEKLEVIMEEIEKRKKAILESLSFASYAKQHPGLEHKCGTHRGGTFVMVYASKKTFATLENTGGFAVKENVLAATELKKQTLSIAASPYRDLDTFALYIASNDDIDDKESELTKFLRFNSVREGSVAAESLVRDLNVKIANIRQILCRNLTEPEQDVVVADFCLPYLCCSKCPPMAFVIPRERRLLALPTAIACNTSEPISFSLYSPKGAVIDSPEAPKAIIRGENPAFDPTKVPDAQLGKLVTFTLDGEATACVIVVRKPLVLMLKGTVEDIDGDVFVVTFTNSTDESQTGENFYAWTFDDGSSEVAKGKSQLKKRFSIRALAGRNIKTITAKVKVMDDPCNSTGIVTVDVPRHLALPTAIACNTSEPISFSLYSPKGAVIDSPEAPKAIIQGENPAFDPTKVPDAQLGKPVTFTLDGEATACVIVVRKPLVLMLKGTVEDIDGDVFVVTFTNSTDESQTGENSYAWTFDDGSSEVAKGKSQLKKQFSIRALAGRNIKTITAKVKVMDDPCNSTGIVTVDVPRLPSETCKDIVLTHISKARTTLNSEEFRRMLAGVNNNDVKAFYENALKLLKDAAEVVANDDLTGRTRLLSELAGLMRKISSLMASAIMPQEFFRVLEELLRSMLMLMLNLVRCDKKLSGEDLKLVHAMLDRFLDLCGRLKESHPHFDAQDILEKALAVYNNDFVSQEPGIKERLKAILEFLKSLG